MLPSYKDIRERAGEPDWFDQRGVPRYGEFHPDMVTIYDKTVALYLIGCQGCDIQLLVSHVYRGPVDFRMMEIKEKYGGPPDDMDDKEGWKAWEQKVVDEQVPENFAYGDPPRHSCVGDTMGSWTLACVQWWEKEDFEWYRISHKEIVINEDYQAWTAQLGLTGEDPSDILQAFTSIEEEEDVPLGEL